MRPRFVLAAVVCAVLAVGACRKAAPPAPPAAPGGPPTVEVLKGGRWLFTYAEPAGTFATTDKPETVPAPSRGLVRVIDPAGGAPAGDDRVYVTNLNDLVDKGKTTARPMSREAFETGALAALPSGQSSPFAVPPAAPPPPPGGRVARRATSAPGRETGGYDLRHLLVRRLPRGARIHDSPQDPVRRQGHRARPRRRARAGREGGQDGRSRPTGCPSSTCAAGCCSGSTRRASRRCWGNRLEQARRRRDVSVAVVLVRRCCPGPAGRLARRRPDVVDLYAAGDRRRHHGVGDHPAHAGLLRQHQRPRRRLRYGASRCCSSICPRAFCRC